MAALFYSFGKDDMFKNSLGGSNVPPAELDILAGFVSKQTTAIITNISVANTELNQFFITFDDFIHHFYFGKGLGSIAIQGLICSTCTGEDASGELPGIDFLYARVARARGQIATLSLGSNIFEGVITDFSVSLVSEPETMAQFTINLAMTNHYLPTPPPRPKAC